MLRNPDAALNYHKIGVNFRGGHCTGAILRGKANPDAVGGNSPRTVRV